MKQFELYKNRLRERMLPFEGKTLSVVDWERIRGVKRATIHSRLRRYDLGELTMADVLHPGKLPRNG